VPMVGCTPMGRCDRVARGVLAAEHRLDARDRVPAAASGEHLVSLPSSLAIAVTVTLTPRSLPSLASRSRRAPRLSMTSSVVASRLDASRRCVSLSILAADVTLSTTQRSICSLPATLLRFDSRAHRSRASTAAARHSWPTRCASLHSWPPSSKSGGRVACVVGGTCRAVEGTSLKPRHCSPPRRSLASLECMCVAVIGEEALARSSSSTRKAPCELRVL
jgi:hypothetical protein